MRRNLAAIALVFMMVNPVHGQEAKPAMRELAAAVAAQVIAPRFAALDRAFAAQEQAWDRGCGDATPLKDAFQSAYDAWAQTEFFKSGPLAIKTRAERIDYWPDPRNAVDKGLKAVLALPATDVTAEKIASESVAVQGLPALERLLFAGEGAETKAIGNQECALGRAISHNLAGVAAELDREWSDEVNGEAVRLKAATSDDAKARENTVALLTDLATGIRIIEDRKIPPLFGSKGAAPNPHAAKAWRSSRSARDLAQNLLGLLDAYAAIARSAPEASASVIAKLKDASAALDANDDPNRAIAVVSAVNNAKYYAIDVLPGEAGVTLGFNSLDGD